MTQDSEPMTTIEKLAVAARDELVRQEPGPLITHNGSTDCVMIGDCAFDMTPLVRAILTALREPGEGALQSLRVLRPDHSGAVNIGAATGAWREAIDHILAEKQP